MHAWLNGPHITDPQLSLLIAIFKPFYILTSCEAIEGLDMHEYLRCYLSIDIRIMFVIIMLFSDSHMHYVLFRIHDYTISVVLKLIFVILNLRQSFFKY